MSEYEDTAACVYRAATFKGDRLDTCVFISPSDEAIGWDAVKDVFAAETITEDQRRLLLSGKSADGVANSGPVVCACFGVGRTAICSSIASGARTAADIGAELKAGTNCGSCIPELKRLIAQTSIETSAGVKVAASAAS